MFDATPKASNGRSRSVALDGRVVVGGARLAAALREAGLDAIELPDGGRVEQRWQALSEPPDLMIVMLHPQRLERLRELHERADERGWRFPILGVAQLGQIGAEVGLFRAHGVVGVIDARTSRACAVDRILRQLGVGPSGVQASVRAPCTFPVTVSGGTARRCRELALNVSFTGIRITSARAIELNALIGLRFRLPMIDCRAIEADARVVHRTTYRNSWGRWEIGLFFTAIEDSRREIIGREVVRLLTH